MYRYHRFVVSGVLPLLLGLLQACSHPLDITGSGDIAASGAGGSACALEDAPCPNYIVSTYNTTYTANSRAGFGFLNWTGCPTTQGNKCILSVPGNVVFQFWGQTMPPLRANFSPHVSIGNLTGDFSDSADCEGHAFSPNPEVVFRFRDSTGVDGENQKQCLANTIVTDTATGVNFLVWLDILHIDSENQPVFDAVGDSFPVREIYASFGEPFILGKRYTISGVGLQAGPSPVSVQIAWIDIDAQFNEFTQCIVTESQSPIGATTRRKTYCPRFDSTYEIMENVVIPAFTVN